MKTIKQQTELTSLQEIKQALITTFVFCDIINPDAKHIPVRDVRAFRSDRSLESVSVKDPRWTSLVAQGNAKGFEVLVLEGWHVPEKVYTLEK